MNGTQTLFTVLLWFLALGSGLIGGLFFAFSTFIMTALRRLPPGQGALAMNAINSAILRSLFMPIFLGTTLVSLALVLLALFRAGEGVATLIVAATIVYVAGMFGVTLAFNVPLNNALAAADPARPEGTSVWEHYLKRWTAWNHVRTIASLIACALYVGAIADYHS